MTTGTPIGKYPGFVAAPVAPVETKLVLGSLDTHGNTENHSVSVFGEGED